MRINNERTNALRNTAGAPSISSDKLVDRDESILEELTTLIDEIANLRRDLTKKNVELDWYRAAAKEDQAVCSRFMSQLAHVYPMADPLLRYWLQPTSNSSGDLIAAARTPGGALHLILADGSSQGLAASLTVMPIVDPFYTMTAKGLVIGAIAAELNRKLKRWLPTGRYASAALIAFEPNEKTLEVWCGGIPPPLLLSARGELIFQFSSTHAPLGLLGAADFDSRTQLRRIDEPGQLVVYSDGVTEAKGADGTQFGRERLINLLRGAPVTERVDRLKHALADHCAGRPALDCVSVATIDCFQLQRDNVAVRTQGDGELG